MTLPTDGSSRILTEYASQAPRIRVYRNKHNIGSGPSRNIGISAARGKYLQFTDADDLVPCDALKALYDLAERTGCAAVRGTFEVFPDGPIKDWLAAPDREFFAFWDERSTSVPWFHQSYLFRRALLLNHGIEYPNLKDGEDPAFLASALVKARYVSATSQTCYLYRAGDPSRRITLAHLLDHLRHIRLVRDVLMPEFPRVWDETCSGFYLELAREILEDNAVLLSGSAAATDIVSQIWRPQQLVRLGIPASIRQPTRGSCQ